MAIESDLARFRKKVRDMHAPAFSKHLAVARQLEAAYLDAAHGTDVVSIVLDMLLLQGYKSHLSVPVLCEHGFVEDAATITRRLLELSVQAVYIGGDDQATTCERRAGRYLAHLWRKFPRRFKSTLPAGMKAQWSRIARQYGRFVPKNANTWGPNWLTMFREIGHEQLYRSDYSLLSSIAHGRPDDQILTYSQAGIRVHRHEHSSVMLVYSTKYYLAIFEQWNRRTLALGDLTVGRLARQLADWTF